jgi:hypothetical protein
MDLFLRSLRGREVGNNAMSVTVHTTLKSKDVSDYKTDLMKTQAPMHART